MVFCVSSLLPHKILFFAYIPASHSPPPPHPLQKMMMMPQFPLDITCVIVAHFKSNPPPEKGEGEEDNVIPRGGMKKKKKRKFIRRVIEKMHGFDHDGSMQ